MSRPAIKKNILVALNSADGVPMPESALIQFARNLGFPDKPTVSDVIDALKAVEADGYVSGVTDDLMGRSWTLTEKGVHKARQL